MNGAESLLQTEGAIVVDEALTTRTAYQGFAPAALPHTVLSVTGGSIGQGLPCAVGAALACPDRKVIAFEADGSGMYTPQALWTMAREGLDAHNWYGLLQGFAITAQFWFLFLFLRTPGRVNRCRMTVARAAHSEQEICLPVA